MRLLPPRHDKGFTLIELVASVLLFGALGVVGVVAISSLISNSRAESLRSDAATFDSAYRTALAADKITVQIDPVASEPDRVTRVQSEFTTSAELSYAPAPARPGTVRFARAGVTVCLSLTAEPSTRGEISTGTCPTPPDAPADLTATSGFREATLAWAAPGNNGGSDISDYTVQFSADAGTTWTTFQDGVSTSTSATVTGLADSTTYTFRVAAVNSQGPGAWSATASSSTATTPGAPTDPTATAGDASATLAWTAPSSDGGTPVIDYLVQYSANDGAAWSTFQDGVSTATSATVTGLANGSSYLFRVAARNLAGDSPYTQTSSATTPRTTPGAPTALTATGGLRQATLDWNAPASNGGSAVLDYTIEYSANGGTSWTTFQDGFSSATSAVLTGLEDSTTYTFRVSAVNAAGTGTASATVSASTATTPGAPTGLTATRGNAQAALSWTAAIGNGGSEVFDYVIQYSANGGGVWVSVTDGISTSTSATVTGLSNGTTYSFRVTAVNAVGTGAWSNTATATPATTPGTPTVTSTSSDTSSLTVSFSAPASNGGSAITGYTVTCTSSNGGTTRTGTGSGSPITVSSLDAGKNYSCTMFAANAVGNSSSVSVTTMTAVSVTTNWYRCPSSYYNGWSWFLAFSHSDSTSQSTGCTYYNVEYMNWYGYYYTQSFSGIRNYVYSTVSHNGWTLS
jgi:large repetitive protein